MSADCMLTQYLANSIFPRHLNNIFFPVSRSVKRKISTFLEKKNKPVLYTRTREISLNAFEKIGREIGSPRSKFGLHSLCAGDATATANSGLPDRLFKRHGRWKSENAEDGYIKDNLKTLLSVSKNFEI